MYEELSEEEVAHRQGRDVLTCLNTGSRGSARGLEPRERERLAKSKLANLKSTIAATLREGGREETRRRKYKRRLLGGCREEAGRRSEADPGGDATGAGGKGTRTPRYASILKEDRVRDGGKEEMKTRMCATLGQASQHATPRGRPKCLRLSFANQKATNTALIAIQIQSDPAFLPKPLHCTDKRHPLT